MVGDERDELGLLGGRLKALEDCTSIPEVELALPEAELDLIHVAREAQVLTPALSDGREAGRGELVRVRPYREADGRLEAGQVRLDRLQVRLAYDFVGVEDEDPILSRMTKKRVAGCRKVLFPWNADGFGARSLGGSLRAVRGACVAHDHFVRNLDIAGQERLEPRGLVLDEHQDTEGGHALLNSLQF